MTIQVMSNEKPEPPESKAQAIKEAEASKASEGNEKDESSLSAPGENESTEQKESSEPDSESTKTEAKEGNKGDDEQEPGQKKKGGFQRRIDKLSSQKAQAQQELEYWKQLAIKNAGSNPSQTTPTPVKSVVATEGKPNPDQFDTHAEYVEALADWKTEQKLKERDEKAQKERLDQEQSKIMSSYQERMKSFAEKTSDFQEVLGEVDHVPLSPALRDIILNSDNGPQIAYELAKNPGEYERIAKLPPLACAREVGKFEARLSSSSSKGSADEKVNEKKITKAPKPLEPVGTGGKGSVPKSIYDPDVTQAEYEALRAKQRAKKTG